MITNDEKNIERYLAGVMNSKEARDFEDRLDTDPELASAYANTLAAHQLITQAGRLELKQTLERIDDNMNSKEGKVIPKWIKRAIPIAAFFVIFFGVYQFAIFNKSASGSDVFNSYFEPFSNPGMVRELDSSNLINWETAANSYREKEFENAITFFNKSTNEVPSYLTSFYIGVSSLAQKEPNYQIALENFETVLNTDSDFKQQALWYKGLTLLRINKQTDALDIFNEIVINKSYNYLKAEEIIKLKIKN